jgi:hypothetical protein
MHVRAGVGKEHRCGEASRTTADDSNGWTAFSGLRRVHLSSHVVLSLLVLWGW